MGVLRQGGEEAAVDAVTHTGEAIFRHSSKGKFGAGGAATEFLEVLGEKGFPRRGGGHGGMGHCGREKSEAVGCARSQCAEIRDGRVPKEVAGVSNTNLRYERRLKNVQSSQKWSLSSVESTLVTSRLDSRAGWI